MSKRIIRVLSMVLTLVMLLSVSTPAFAWGGIDTGSGWDRQIDEDDFREIEPAEEVEEEEVYDYFQTSGEGGYQVSVEAPMGSLPMLAELRAEPVEIEDVREAVESVVGGEANILVAMDISFWMNGIEIEPEESVNVKISAPELTGKTNLTVIHIPDEDEPETVDLIDEEDLSFPLGTNEIAFRADSFSTYVITWDGDESATVHWGTMNGSNFEEFDEAKVVTLDTTAATISLDVDFEGYAFSNATYKPAEGDEVSIGATLQKVDDKWQVETRVMNAETGELESAWVDLQNGDEIFVAYVVPQSNPGTPTDPSKVPVPDTDKNVLANDDGTRTIVLDVTGTKVTEDNSHGANVLIVLDRTASMGDPMPNSTTTRWAAAKSAINTLVTTLSTGANAGNDIEFGLLDFVCPRGYNNGDSTNFGNWFNPNYYYIQDTLHRWNTAGAHANSGSYWTKNATAYNTNFIQQSSFTHPEDAGGTNWQAALRDTQTMLAANARDDDMTYVIFLTDGEPSMRGLTSTNLATNGDLIDPALTEAKTIVGMPNIQFYGVFVGSDKGYKTLSNLVSNAGGVKTINGTDSPALNNEFAKIAETIINDLFANDVSVDDGVPSLSSVSSGVVEGGAGGYEYFRLYPLTPNGSNYTYKVGETTTDVTAAQVAAGNANGNVIEKQGDTYYIEIPWTEGYPGASYNQANGVTWDLSTVSVQPGVTYRLKFKVWPSQEAYDTIADLNNGLITMTPEQLDAAGIGGDKEHGYYLLTNTHLKTTYSFKGTTYEDEPEELPKDEMKLPTTTISVKKIWNNNLDARQAQGVELTVTKDGTAYAPIQMGTPVEKIPGKQWVQTPEKEIYISMGQLTLDSTTNDIDVISAGHDYTVIEPESFSYNWELTADVYHPMVINGTATVLVEVTEEQKAELPAVVSGLAQNKHIEKDDNHYYAFNGKLYVAQSGKNVLTATNDRRSNLNLTKKVEAAEGIQIPEDGLFTYSIKITYPEGINDSVWFSIQDDNGSYILNGDYGVNDYITGATQEADKTMDDSYTNVVFHVADDTHHYNYYTYTRYGENLHAPAADDGTGTTHKIHTGFYYAPDATAFTVKIRAGWNVRFTNMPNDTQYEFIETAQDDGYVFKTAASTVDRDGTPGALEEGTAKVTGTIDKPNNTYTTTYTNTFLGFFYVYHSGDNTVQRFPIAKNGVALYSETSTFDLTELVDTSKYLYGGYYKNYAGKSTGFDAAKLTYDADGKSADTGDGFKPYTVDNRRAGTTWSWGESYNTAAGDKPGNKMVPEVNMTYYLKEVPVESYLQPYFHYTYRVGSGEITGGWLMSDVDDTNFLETGFVIYSDAKHQAKIGTRVKITSTASGEVYQLTSENVFSAPGYISYLQTIHNSALVEGTGFGPNCQVTEYWVTPDGLYVNGINLRSFAKVGNIASIQANEKDDDKPITSLIQDSADFQEWLKIAPST